MKITAFSKIAFATALIISLIGISALQGVKASELQRVTFSDVQKSQWYASTIEWGISLNMVKGYADGTYKPNKTVTEAEFLAMLIRAFEPNLTSDGKIHWADPYYVRAKQMNYPVKSYTQITPRNSIILRKQVAEIISAAEGVHFTGDDAIHYLLAFGLANGSDPTKPSIQGFHGELKLTRAEALQFIKNLYENGVGGLLERPQEATDPRDIPDF
ncbi:MAG: S-layer homology domain-containing protein [Paenibacillus sp.]|nr:S-layer homology domain-containing protein [Paenibacillus sp.]